MIQRLFTLLAAALVIACAPVMNSPEADRQATPFELTAKERADLTDDQIALAETILDFLIRMDQKHFERAAALNGGLALETKDFRYDFGHYQTKVTRGPVVEKIGRMMGSRTKPNTERLQQTQFSRFFGIDIHPATPFAGMLHATLVFQFFEDGTSHIGGYVDALPGEAMAEQDIALLKQTLDARFDKHGVDGTKYRRSTCRTLGLYRGLNEGKYDRRGSCAGVNYYGPDMMPVTAANVAFIDDAYDSFVTAYMDIIEARKDDPVTDEDIAAQDGVRRNWFEDQTMADPFAAEQIVPYEVWSHAFLPPVVKF